MKKSLLTDSEKRLLMIVMALGLLVCAYFFGFNKMMEQAKQVEASNQQDQAMVTQLEGMVARQGLTEQETQGYKDEIKRIIEKYPSALPQEKIIYLVQQMQDNTGVDFSSVSFVMDNVLYAFSNAENNPVGYYSSISLPFEATYDVFKTMVDYTKACKDRTTMPVVSANFDQATGNLSGAVTFRMFYLTNTDKAYEELPDTGIPSGVSNIFGTEGIVGE